MSNHSTSSTLPALPSTLSTLPTLSTLSTLSTSSTSSTSSTLSPSSPRKGSTLPSLPSIISTSSTRTGSTLPSLPSTRTGSTLPSLPSTSSISSTRTGSTLPSLPPIPPTSTTSTTTTTSTTPPTSPPPTTTSPTTNNRMAVIPSVSCYVCKTSTQINSTYNWYTYVDTNRVVSWATVQSYKLDGLGSIKTEKYPVYICNLCINKFKLTEIDPDPATACEVCHKKYLSFHENCDWGYNCDSAIYDDAIICGVGSRYDDYELQWTSGERPVEYKNKKIICDSCIDHLINNNIVRTTD